MAFPKLKYEWFPLTFSKNVVSFVMLHFYDGIIAQASRRHPKLTLSTRNLSISLKNYTSRIMEGHSVPQASYKADVRLFSVLHLFIETHKTNTNAFHSIQAATRSCFNRLRSETTWDTIAVTIPPSITALQVQKSLRFQPWHTPRFPYFSWCSW